MDQTNDGYFSVDIKDGYQVFVLSYMDPLDGYGVIYKATSPSGKVYIGQTIEMVSTRIKRHYADANRSSCGNYKCKFYNALRKYGNKVTWECLLVVEDSLLDDIEIEEISKYGSFVNGYNTTIGGQGKGTRGMRHSEESKRKMSKAHSGKKTSASFLLKNSKRMRGQNNPMYGTKMSEEHKQKLRKIIVGRFVSEEERRKMSEAGRGKKNSFEHNSNIKSALRNLWGSKGKNFFVFDKSTGEFIGEWNTIGGCAEDLSLQASNVGNCLRGSRKSCGGYIFSYKGTGNAKH